MSEHKIPEEALRQLCASVDGDCGLYVSAPGEGLKFSINEDKIFTAASTIKIPVLARLFQDAAEGRVDLSEKVVVKPDNRAPGSGILLSMEPDIELSIFDLASLMIVMSDNTATNEIIDVVGMDRVRQFCTDHDFTNTWIWKKIFYKGELPPPQVPEGMPHTATTAGDLGRMLEQLADGTLLDEASCRKIIQIMANQRVARLKTLLPTAYRPDPRKEALELPKEGQVVVASKGGTLTDPPTAHDAGIFYLPDGRYYIVTICTRSSSLKEATKIINEVGLVMYEAMK